MSGVLRGWKLLALSILNVCFLFIGLVITGAFFVSHEKRIRARARGMSLWAKSACRIMGVVISSANRSIPATGAFIVSNHCSYLDILVLGSLFPAVFVAKKEIASWPLLGLLASLAGTHFVQRKSRKAAAEGLAQIRQLLSRGVNVIVFPEATTNDGMRMKQFKSLFFEAPLNAKAPILPLSIVYTHIDSSAVPAGASNPVAWHGDMELISHLWDVLGMRRIDVHVCCLSLIREVLSAEGSRRRKILASVTHEQIQSGLECAKRTTGKLGCDKICNQITEVGVMKSGELSQQERSPWQKIRGRRLLFIISGRRLSGM
ncbi:MAG: lysophospholipid acyltransferase family protein [Nitrospiraceae bacterium]|nr:lysophospholipid acyltransferase family protein [Nitrospiraceae bacterium]